jgi:HEPN domain-containing protein
MTPQLEEIRRLLGLAVSDREAFLWMLKGQGLRPAATFFFAQQSIEKSLKAVMLMKGLAPGRTHNLLSLAGELNGAGIPTPISADELARLNPYAVTLRYDDENLSLLSPQEAMDMLNAILSWAKKLFAETDRLA